MQCQITLDQLRSFLCSNDSESGVDPTLRTHIGDCSACRSRLDWLTQDGSLAKAALTTMRGDHQHSESKELRLALDTVDSMIQARRDRTLDGTNSISSSADLDRLLDPTGDPGSLGLIGRYQAQSVLGRGGMSIVFAAWDPLLDRHVAIKVLNSHRDERTWQRFAREARAVARIEHDAVVPLYEVVERNDRPPALVMPLMSRGTLQHRLDRESITPRRAAEITARIAIGLAEVHRHSQIHRDIKPGNILFDNKDRAKLGDFSLVRRDEDEPLTQDNVLPGTPEFIAPEMLVGATADARSDIYQLGLTLYTMLTGAPPFRGSVRSILRQIAEESPPNLGQCGNGGVQMRVPWDLETICMKAIERQPSDRYQHATELADDLQQFLAGDPISASRPSVASRLRRSARRHPVKFSVAGIAAPSVFLLFAAYGSIQYQHRQHERETEMVVAQRDADRVRLAEQTHRADLAELKSNQALSQTFSTVLSSQRVREPNWTDTEKTVTTALLGGLEQGFQQMQLDPERNPSLGEMSLTIARLRQQVGKTAQAQEAYRQAIKEFDRRLGDEPTEILWQHMTNARRGYGKTCRKLNQFEAAIEHLQLACSISQRHTNANLESLKWKLEWAMSETELGLTLIAAGKGSQSDSHLDSAAIRIRVIANAERPKVDLVGFDTLFAESASFLAQAFRRRARFERAVTIQRMAMVQIDRLGNDEISSVKRSDAFSASAALLVEADRPVAAMKALRRAVGSLDTAIHQSNFPGRYRKRRAELKNQQQRLARQTATRLTSIDRES